VESDSRVRYRFDCEARVIFLEEFALGELISVIVSGGTFIRVGPSDETEEDNGAGFGVVLRLNANLDFGAADARRSSSILPKVFSC
jgi:hypothetical protein